MQEHLARLVPLLAVAAAACSDASPARTNVLLLVLDTTRADAVSVHDDAAGRPSGPLRELAEDGVVFTHARTVSAWTLPSHGSLFTGLYPSRHGAHHESHLLRGDVQTLAELLESTHVTAGFSENPHIGRTKGFAQGFGSFVDTWRTKRERATVDQVLEWLETVDRARPFLLFVNLMHSHLPYRPPAALLAEELPPDAPAEDVRRLAGFSKVDCMRYEAGELELDPDDLAILRAFYRAAVRHVEEEAGRLLEGLEAEGLLDETLVVVVGDHGENVGEHDLLQHQYCLYDSLLRVPLVVRLPGTFEGGERRDDPVQLVDLMPTVLDVVGVPRGRWPEMEGTSLLAGALHAERPVVAEYMRPQTERRRFRHAVPGFDFEPFDRRLQSYQIGALKLIRDDRGAAELYDLSEDPRELRDLSAERPEDVARLSAELDAWARSRPAARSLDEVEMDDATRSELEALGYL